MPIISKGQSIAEIAEKNPQTYNATSHSNLGDELGDAWKKVFSELSIFSKIEQYKKQKEEKLKETQNSNRKSEITFLEQSKSESPLSKGSNFIKKCLGTACDVVKQTVSSGAQKVAKIPNAGVKIVSSGVRKFNELASTGKKGLSDIIGMGSKDSNIATSEIETGKLTGESSSINKEKVRNKREIEELDMDLFRELIDIKPVPVDPNFLNGLIDKLKDTLIEVTTGAWFGDKINAIKNAAIASSKEIEESAKIAAEETKEAANKAAEETKKAAEIVASRTKETANKAAEETKKSAEIVARRTKEAANKAAEETKKSAEIVARRTKEAANKAAEETKKSAEIVASRTKETANKVAEDTKKAAKKEADRIKNSVKSTASKVSKWFGGRRRRDINEEKSSNNIFTDQTSFEENDLFIPSVDTDGILILLNLMVRKYLGNTDSQSLKIEKFQKDIISQAQAINIIEIVDDLIKYAAKHSGLSILSIPYQPHEFLIEIKEKIMSDRYYEIPGLLNSKVLLLMNGICQEDKKNSFIKHFMEKLNTNILINSSPIQNFSQQVSGFTEIVPNNKVRNEKQNLNALTVMNPNYQRNHPLVAA